MNLHDNSGKTPPQGRWFPSPNWVVDDETMSLKAKMVYLVLLRYRNQEGVAWPSHATIARKCGEGMGVTSVKVGIAELVEMGLLDKVTKRTATGRVNEYRLSTNEGGSVATRPMGQSPRGQEEDLEDKDPPTPRKRGKTDEDFEKFWDTYGKKIARPTALTAWRRAMKVTDAQTILAAVPRYLSWLKAEGKEDFQRHPATWLNQHGWLDEITPKRIAAQRASNIADDLESIPPGLSDREAIEWDRAYQLRLRAKAEARANA